MTHFEPSHEKRDLSFVPFVILQMGRYSPPAGPDLQLFKLPLVTYMRKPTKWLCAQWRLISAWASAQSDQSLHCPHEETLGPWLSIECTAKTLIRLSGCPGWTESSLGAQSLCWFCHVVAHIVWANSKGCGETVWMHRLAWTFTVCWCDKYPFHMGGSFIK